MNKHDKESIKKKIAELKGPPKYVKKGPVKGGKKQAAKLMDGALCGDGFKQGF